MTPAREPAPPTSDVDPSLLDVIPWSYGYAHSWALGVLLNDERTQVAILSRLPLLPGRPPHRIDGAIAREKGVRPRRADFAFTLVDGDGADHRVAVETKVNDPFDAAQVLAYRDAGYVPLLNLPASTGVLLAATEPTEAREIRLTAGALLEAVDSTGLSFSALLNGYLDALRSEVARTERALALARGESTDPVGDGWTPTSVLEDVAWIAEIFRALPAAAERAGIESGASIRIEANDRGIFYSDSFAWTSGDGGLWVDVIADVRTGHRSVAVKAGEAGLAQAWDAAAAAGPPSEDGWRRTARRVNGGTCSVWKLDVERTFTAFETAQAAVQAARMTRSLDDGDGHS